MPVLNDLALDQINLSSSNYGYSATRIDDLGAAEYTIVSIVVDVSGSVATFEKQIEACLKQIVQSCRLSSRADNLMLRLVSFNEHLTELHGFKLLERCNLSDYDGILHPHGSTALFDATENTVSATADYGRRLTESDFAANGILFVLTDGADNVSRHTAVSVRQALQKAITGESLESLASILIGVNVDDPEISRYLKDFQTNAGFTQYVEIARADAKTLAKLADFVTQSISIQSRSIGSGSVPPSLTF